MTPTTPAERPDASPLTSPVEAAAALGIPGGFRPLRSMGDFIAANGPLHVRSQDGVVQLGFRVEARHTNPMRICHGGMMASFCDMLLPISIHRKSKEIGFRFLPTINLQIDYLAPARLGAWVEGEADLLKATRSLVFAQGLVTADGMPCARVSGIFKIGPPFQPDPALAG